MKKYKYITIELDGEFNGKLQYKIINNKSKSTLGILFYYKEWKQYVFTQWKQSVIFNNSCLMDIVNFLNIECGSAKLTKP